MFRFAFEVSPCIILITDQVRSSSCLHDTVHGSHNFPSHRSLAPEVHKKSGAQNKNKKIVVRNEPHNEVIKILHISVYYLMEHM